MTHTPPRSTSDKPHPFAAVPVGPPIGAISLLMRRKSSQNRVIRAVQLSMLLEGIDWRAPRRSWTPEVAS